MRKTGLALLASNGCPRPVSEPVLLELATGAIGPVRHMVLVALVVAVIGHVVLYHTGSGTHLLAVGGNREAARNMGVRVERVKIAAYAASGLTAGIAGVLLTARLGAAEPAAGTSYLLNSIAAVVLGGVSLFGGRGTVFGPVVGALVLTTLLNGLTLLGVAVFYQPVAVGVVVILSAVLTRWRGR